MAYWWVNQGQTFKYEYAGKFLWAPIENERQQTMFHWSNLGKVTAGDTIFCYVDGLIRTVATALNNAYISQKPSEFGNLWQGEGWCVDVNFIENIEPLALNHVNDLTAGLWPDKYSPIQPSGRVNQGYFYKIPIEVGVILLNTFKVPSLFKHTQIEDVEESQVTEKDALVKARVGQGKFRKLVIDYWSGECAITKFPNTGLLVASHIKPWAISNNKDRLDPYNGLLLSPNYNALFDRFLISFSSEGKIMKSDLVDWADLKKLDIQKGVVLDRLTPKHHLFLENHQELMKSKKVL